MPRVSEVLDYFQEPFLVKWKCKMAVQDPKQLTEDADALRIGSLVDQMIQDEINRVEAGKYTIDDDIVGAISNCMKGWEAFKKSEKPDEKDLLKRMYEYKDNMQKELVLGDIIGHPDFILGDEVCDLKTSKQVGKSHWMQTAQYAKMTGQEIKTISVLRLDKATPGLYEYKVLKEPFISFWQGKFEARYEAFREDQEFAEMMRKKLEEERLK